MQAGVRDTKVLDSAGKHLRATALERGVVEDISFSTSELSRTVYIM